MNDKSILSLIESGARIIDVRTPEEYNEGHYPGAENIPIDEIIRNGFDSDDKSEQIVLYCKSGGRSGTALLVLQQLGFINVVNAGGLKDMPK